MNNLNTCKALLRLLSLCLLVILAGCDQSDSSTETSATADTALEHAVKHLDANYVCPMHPQISRGEPGSCPICGMDLVKKTLQPQPAAESSAMQHATKHLDANYVCPMHPQISRGEPGSCPICGMDLVKKTTQPQQTGQPVISISAGIRQAMGLRTATATSGRLNVDLNTTATLAYDENRLVHVHPRADGWMEQLKVRSEGEAVRKGQHLGDFYSPDILSAQVDFLIALGNQQTQSKVRLEKARNRLRLFGVPESAITQIEQTGQTRNTIPVYAPADGIITMLTAREGMFISTSEAMFTIADLSQIWVLASVYERDLEALQLGEPVDIQVNAYPGRNWQGKLDYIYPELDARTRTLPIRVVVENPHGELHPNLFARISIRSEAQSDVVSIPRQALIVTGSREVVVLALDEGKFQALEVVSGKRNNDRVEIRQGLSAGDQVVVSGQFLIDSESSLQASFQRLSGE